MINPHYSAASASVKPRVSVVVRCYNEEKHIGRLLEGLLRQSLTDVEIIVVDSGSTDATLAIASRYPTKCVRIPKQDFSFGRSLNLGCSAASGDVIVAVSAHCYPVYPDWLEQLIAPFLDTKVAMSYGKQRGNGLNKFSERQIYRQWFGEESNPAQQHPFANNANSAFRRDLWQSQPFDETLTGLEDLDWAHKVLRNGYRIAYVAEAPVIHVHEETWRQTYNRYRREAIAMRHILPQERFTFLDLLRLSLAGVVGDIRVAWNEGGLRRELSSILSFRMSQYIGTYHGYRQRDMISQNLRETFYYPGENRTVDASKPTGVKSSASAPISYVNSDPAATRRTPLDGARLHDVSRALDRAPVWPGDLLPELARTKSLSDGDGVTVSNLSMCIHTGTHIDAPAHFIEDGEMISDIGLERMLGRVQVVDMGDALQIDAHQMQQAGIAPECRRVLFRTRNSRLLHDSAFNRDYVALTPDGAEWINRNGISLVGIDYASIERYDEPDNRTHKILLEAGVVVIEGLDLSQVAAGSYELLCLPLKIGMAEAAPARVVLIDDGEVA